MFEELTDLEELRPDQSPGWPERDGTAGFARSRYYFDEAGAAFFVLVRFGAQAEGQVGVVHGGAISWVLDQAMGAASWLAGLEAATARLAVRYRKPVPIGVELLATGRVTRQEGRRIRAEGQMRDEEGIVYATSTALLVRVDGPPGEPSDAERGETATRPSGPDR